MNQSMMTGYAVVIMGVVIVMYAVAAAATGQALAEKNAGALLSFGGFITGDRCAEKKIRFFRSSIFIFHTERF